MPLAPPVIKIVLLVSFIIKYLGGQSARERRCGLDSKPFTNQVRLDFPRKRSGHEGVQDAVQPTRNDFGAVFDQTAEALRYALLDAQRFHRHGLRIEAELFEHRCVRKPGCQYSDVDTERFELKVKRFAKAVDIRLRSSVIRHNGNAVFRTHGPREDDSAPAPLAELLAEMVGDVQMSHRTKSQGLPEQLPIMLQELAGISGAGIGDDKADVEITRGIDKGWEEVRLRKVERDDTVLDTRRPGAF